MFSRDKLFWDKVDQQGPDDCWNWKASVNRDGYGQFWIGYTFVPSHRYAYVYHSKKALTPGILICHHCDNPRCCNPNHLFEGTAQDNAKDRISKGRQGNSTPVNPAKGVRHWNSYLHDEDVSKIRRLSKAGVTGAELSKTFRVSRTQISYIIRRINWRHI